MDKTVLTAMLLSACSGPQNVRGQTSVDFGVDAGRGRPASVSAGLSHRGRNWGAGVRGTVDSRGSWGVSAGLSFRFRKRSIDESGEHYTVKLHADSCDFNVYDINRDGVIVKNEFKAIFGDNLKVNALFNALDITTGDGRIEEEEFYLMSHVFISGCDNVDKQRRPM